MSIVDELAVSTNGGHEAASPAAEPPLLPPLIVSALMVTKPDLIAALRAYLPDLTDIEAIDGGERFLLTVAGPRTGEGSD